MDWEQALLRRPQSAGDEGSILFQHGVISGSTAAEAREAERPNNELLCPDSVRLKHTFHTNSEDGDKRIQVIGAARLHPGSCSGLF